MNGQRDELVELGAIYTDTLNRGHGVISRFEQGVRAAEAILAAGYRKPRTITTVEELDALPHGAAVFNNNNESVSKYGDWWLFPGIKHRFAVAAVSLPATVLYEPTP